MDTTSIRQRLHSWLETADEKKLRAIYTMVEDDVERDAVVYTEDYKQELNRRVAAYKDGSEPAITAQESKERINKLLQAARK
jgi:putative addiction module component (TIGR02574 family)